VPISLCLDSFLLLCNRYFVYVVLCLLICCIFVHGEVDLVALKPDPYDHYFLQCFDAVCLVI